MHNPTIPQDIADKALPCNGRELVAAILDHPQGGVGALLSFVGNQETEWLEFKAALYPPEGNFDRGENEDDLQWNIAEAVIALANTLGGAVVLGVDDKSGQSVGLMCSDPKGILESQGREAFNREIILEGTLFKKAGWKTGKKGNIRMEQLQRVKQLVEIRDIEYQGYPLAILLVYPVKDSPIEVSIERSNIPRSATFMRQPGNVGQVVEIQGFSNVGVAFERRNIELNSDKFTNIWQKFLAGLPSIDQQQRMVALEKSLMAYCQQVQQSFGKLQSWFTPLDADERLAEENRLTFEPEAEESLDLYPVDEPWDSWDEEFSDDTEEDEDEEDENDNELEDESDLKLPMPSRLARRGGVFELLEQEPRTILLGEPGAGKTTCLKWLAWEAAVKYQSSAVLILFVPLNQYTSNGLRNLLLKYATVNKSAESHGIEWRDLESLIIQNRLRILLDAFNECPLHLRTQCCQDIYGLLVDYPNILLVVSSRASAYPSQLCLPTFTVRPLDRDQQQRFLAAYLLGDENKAAAILSHLYRQPGGDLIASTPILLRIVREVSKKQGELPHGRALLYRQFFEDWYVREQKKENHTGASLPWSLQKTREALACLAFATRREGQVSCELNRALQRLTPLLHEHARAFLERMAQGLLLTLDEEDQNLAFEHETFQEYFAAEYLIQYPDVLQNLKTEEHASWLMPLAYTFELETQPDIAFIQAAWKLEPLLVAVALRDEAHLRALTIDDGWDPWIRAILRIIRQEEVIPETELIIRKNHAVKLFIPLPDQVKNIFSSKVFWYAGLTYESGKEKLIFLREYFFENSEIWIELIVHACKSNSDWITKLTDIESYQQDRLINNLAYLLKTRAIVRDDIPLEARKNLIKKVNIEKIPNLLRGNLISTDDIPFEIRQTLIQNSSRKKLLELIKAKFIFASDVSSEIRQTLIENSSGKELLELIKAKFIFASDVSSEIRQALIQNSSRKELLRLIKAIVASGLASEIRQALIQNSSGKELLQLIEAKAIVASDISSEIRQTLIQNSSGKELLELIEAKVIVASDISSEIRQTLIQNSSRKELLQLIEAKVIVASDISSEIRQALIQSSSRKELLELIEAKVIVASDISSEIRQALIQSSSRKELLELIEAKVIVASDINPDAIKAMIKTIPYQELKQFIFLEFITRNDFNQRSYKHFIDNLLDPIDLTKFVLIGFIRREDLDIEKRRKIIEKIYLYEDFLGLAKIKFLQRSDLSNANAKMLADKIKNVNELSFFVVNGVLSKYDLSEYKIQSLMKASQIHTLKELQKKLPNDFEKLIKSGVINKNLLREKKSKSIENVTKKPALPTVKTPNKASCFTMNYTELTIYIDEAWPGNILNAKRPQHEGVIAGIVCPGNPETRLRKLTTIKTHTYQNSIPLIQQSLQNLLNCEKCLPFIFPFTLTDSSDQAIRHYDTLLQHAIKLLLGWVLTPSESSGNVRLHLVFELISGHKSGDEHLDFIKGLLAAHPDRYGRWIIGTARWEEKNFGYIPYADLIAHLTLEHTDVNRMLGKSFDYKNWPGYIPFSLDLVPRLERLEHLESVHNVDDLLDFAAENGTSKFGRLVLTDLARRLANKPKLQERLLDALEQRYQDKVRDLGQLRRLFQTVRRLLPPLPTTTPPRLQLLDHLITLQDANHDGNPDRILAAVQRYSTDRNRLKQDQRELCAYTDLNLAVHYADRFEFGRAEATIGEWVHDPLFPALSTQQRGRLYSALGQYRALQNDPLDAAQWFDKALQCFEQLPEGSDRVGEIDQTSVYRAFNALDARFSNAGMLVETVTGPLEQAANRYSTEDSVADQYRHHLLLRYLHDGGDTVKAARTAYLAQLTNWQDGWPQHPWPLIHLYRGLLLWPDHAGDSGKWFDSALELVTLPQHGITLRLIGAMIATTAACCHATPGYKATARQFLAEIGPQLPAAQSILATLEDILWQPAPEKINEALTTLPFNYR